VIYQLFLSVICEEIEAVLKCLNSRSPIKMNIWAFPARLRLPIVPIAIGIGTGGYLAIEKTNYTDEI